MADSAENRDMTERLQSSQAKVDQFLLDALLSRVAETVLSVTADDLRANLGAEDWHDLDLITYERLKGLAGCIRNPRNVLAGHGPVGWTATTDCRNCGPVPTFPGGSDSVLACPWCMNGRTSPPLPGHDQ